MRSQRMLKRNYSLTGVLRIDLNLDVIVFFCWYKISGMIISTKWALLSFVAAVVALFKDFGCYHEYKYLKQVMDIVSSILDVLGMEEGHIEAVIKALILSTTFESWIHKRFNGRIWMLDNFFPTLLGALTERGIIKFK